MCETFNLAVDLSSFLAFVADMYPQISPRCIYNALVLSGGQTLKWSHHFQMTSETFLYWHFLLRIFLVAYTDTNIQKLSGIAQGLISPFL